MNKYTLPDLVQAVRSREPKDPLTEHKVNCIAGSMVVQFLAICDKVEAGDFEEARAVIRQLRGIPGKCYCDVVRSAIAGPERKI